MNDSLYCPGCWNPLSPDTRRCPHCGRPLSSEDVRRQREVAAKVNIEGRRRGGCCAVLLVIALIFAFFSLLRCFLLPFLNATF